LFRSAATPGKKEIEPMSAIPTIALRASTLAVMIGLTAAFLTPLPVASQQVSAETAPEDLAEGEFVWTPEASPSGPIVVVVSITEQRAYVYRNGIIIGKITSRASTRPRCPTPNG
jgi:hypothetical protein